MFSLAGMQHFFTKARITSPGVGFNVRTKINRKTSAPDKACKPSSPDQPKYLARQNVCTPFIGTHERNSYENGISAEPGVEEEPACCSTCTRRDAMGLFPELSVSIFRIRVSSPLLSSVKRCLLRNCSCASFSLPVLPQVLVTGMSVVLIIRNADFLAAVK